METARRHARQHAVTLLLLQEAEGRRDTEGLSTAVCAGDYNLVLDLIACHDRVISW